MTNEELNKIRRQGIRQALVSEYRAKELAISNQVFGVKGAWNAEASYKNVVKIRELLEDLDHLRRTIVEHDNEKLSQRID